MSMTQHIFFVEESIKAGHIRPVKASSTGQMNKNGSYKLKKDCCQKYQKVGASDKMLKSILEDSQMET